MPTVTSELTGEPVDTWSEEYRHECECAWLLANKPTKLDKHLYLFGVPDRGDLFELNRKTGQLGLAENWRSRVPKESKPLIAFRGLEAADRILNDAKLLWQRRQQRDDAA